MRFYVHYDGWHPAFDRKPLDALSTYTYPPIRGAYVVLTGSGILVKKLLLIMKHILSTAIDEDGLQQAAITCFLH